MGTLSIDDLAQQEACQSLDQIRMSQTILQRAAG